MPWTLTRDASEFLRRAGGHLAADRAGNAPLLAEAAYLESAEVSTDGSASPEGLFGWWDTEIGVGGAVVVAPRHAPLLSELSTTAVAELVPLLGRIDGLGVPETLVDDAVSAWSLTGARLTVRRSFTVHRLERPVAAAGVDGAARVATVADRTLLHAWYDELMARHPGDPSERRYIVDDPLSFGGIVLWEVAGRSVAMCGRSRAAADTVRLGPCFAPDPDDQRYVAAAFAAGCAVALESAETVVVLASAADTEEAARLSAAGFVAAATRVALGVEESPTGPV